MAILAKCTEIHSYAVMLSLVCINYVVRTEQEGQELILVSFEGHVT